MKKNLNILFVLVLIATIGSQKAFGQATETMGTNSMTFGITVIAVQPGSAKSSIQPYEILTVTDADPSNEISLAVDTNSIPDNLALSIGGNPAPKYNISLYDLSGKLLLEKETLGKATAIPMASFPPSTYLLKVFQGKNEIRTFRIIKN